MTQSIVQSHRMLLRGLIAVVALLAVACGSDSEPAPTPEVPEAAPTESVTETGTGIATPAGDAGSGGAAVDFPTGEAVLVSADYEHPSDRVDHTGTYLPTNGKPTVVFVDAIW